MLFLMFCFIDFSVSRLFPLPDASNACGWQWQGFRAEYAQTRLRKILPETAQPHDLFTFNEVCTNFNGRARKYAAGRICIWSIRILTILFPLTVMYILDIVTISVPFRNHIFSLDTISNPFYILIHLLMCQFIYLRCAYVLMSHHLTYGFQRNSL